MFGHGEVEIPLREEDELLFSIVVSGCQIIVVDNCANALDGREDV